MERDQASKFVNDLLRLLIDGLIGIRDIVVKALDKIVGQHLGVSGSTILGDGRVIMILDPSALVVQPLSAFRTVPDVASKTVDLKSGR